MNDFNQSVGEFPASSTEVGFAITPEILAMSPNEVLQELAWLSATGRNAEADRIRSAMLLRDFNPLTKESDQAEYVEDEYMDEVEQSFNGPNRGKRYSGLRHPGLIDQRPIENLPIKIHMLDRTSREAYLRALLGPTGAEFVASHAEQEGSDLLSVVEAAIRMATENMQSRQDPPRKQTEHWSKKNFEDVAKLAEEFKNNGVEERYFKNGAVDKARSPNWKAARESVNRDRQPFRGRKVRSNAAAVTEMDAQYGGVPWPNDIRNRNEWDL